jgi:glycosyltransferase involved in cell wall biosynthesis
MNQSYDLSVLIPARNEMFLSRTVEELLKNIRGNTEIIVVLDGVWADPGVPDDPRVTLVYLGKSIGQRAATNLACRLSKAKYVMKLDAHCAVGEGFDKILMENMEDDMTVLPAMYNLHAFDWLCLKCGNRWYQGPVPTHCLAKYEGKEINETCDSTEFKRDIIFQPRKNRRSEFFRFDTTLHFQYHGQRKAHPDAAGDLAETMSAQGSCFMLTREKYWELNICDEGHGSWGQQGTEVACKTWLSGGRLMVNKKTWYSHMFRTQAGFGFPYPLAGSDVEKAREYSRKLWFENAWDKQIYPLSWLIEKFRTLPDWHDPKREEVLEYVNKKGEEFYRKNSPAVLGKKFLTLVREHDEEIPIHFTMKNKKDKWETYPNGNKYRKGIIYYTDNQLNLKIAHAVQKQIKKAGLPIVSSSLKPMIFGKNVHLKLQRGYLTMAKQILAALESSTADIIYFCEHDVLYHPSHFVFTPEKKDVYYYNTNVWRVRMNDGHALWTDDLQQLSGLCAYRETLLTHFRKRVELMGKKNEWYHLKDYDLDTAAKIAIEEFNKFVRQMGFEPGTHGRPERVDDLKAQNYQSKFPNIDIRHDSNLTASRWNKEQFRNKKYTKGWKESTIWNLPGWNLPMGEGFFAITSL